MVKNSLVLWVVLSLVVSQGQAGDKEKYRIATSSKSLTRSSLKTVLCEAHYAQAPDVVWELLNRYSEFPSYIPRIRSVESFGVSDQKERLFISVLVPWPFRDVWNILALRSDALSRRLTWIMEDGNIKKNQGSFVVEPEGKGSKVRVDMTVELGLPNWLVIWGTKRFLPKVFVAIGKRMERNGKTK